MPKDKEGVLSAEEEFDAAFDEATGAKQTDLETEEVEETTSEEEASTEEEEVAPQTEEESEAEDKPDEAASEEKEDSTEEEIDYKSLYEKEKQKTASWDGRIRAANKRAEEAEQRLKEREEAAEEARKEKEEQAKESPPPASEDSMSEEELTEFFEEFPELKKPFTTLARKLGKAEAQEIVKEELKKIQPKLDSVQERQEQDTEEAHFKQITDAHPDWRDFAHGDEFQAFIDSQPSFVRERMIEITQKGNAEQVIELFTSYKDSLPKEDREQTTQEDKSKKADALDAVPSSSGGPPPKGPDKNDFDAGWRDATSSK